jgi:hypothetical protein
MYCTVRCLTGLRVQDTTPGVSRPTLKEEEDEEEDEDEEEEEEKKEKKEKKKEEKKGFAWPHFLQPTALKASAVRCSAVPRRAARDTSHGMAGFFSHLRFQGGDCAAHLLVAWRRHYEVRANGGSD